MAVVDHYDHHRLCILYLWRPEQDGQSLRSEISLGLALPFVFLQNLVTLWRPEHDGQRYELENWKVEYELKMLEPLHIRINSLFVRNLYCTLYEVSNVYLFMFFGTSNDVVIWQLEGWLKGENWILEPVVEQSDTLDYCYKFNEH